MSLFKSFSRLHLVAVSALALASTPALADSQIYTFDPTHTAITWHINHFDFSKPSGKFMDVEGTVAIDEANPAASKVEVTIPLAKVNTGVPKLDEHLQGKDFFNTAAHPVATFVSTHVDLTGKETAKVTGDLTLNGVTKPVVLDVKLNKLGPNLFKKQTAGFSATTTLKRSDFEITTYLPGLGDDITIDIESEANL